MSKSHVHATTNPELIVGIETKKRKDGKISIIATPLYRESEEKVENMAPERCVVKNQKEVASAVDRLIYKITKRYEHRNDSVPVLIEDIILNMLAEFGKEIDSYGFRFSAKWKSSRTNHNALTYFSKNTIKYIMPFLTGEKEFLPSDRIVIKKAIYDDVWEHTRSHDEKTTQNVVNNHLMEADTILAYLYGKLPYLQVISLSDPEEQRVMPTREQPKYIPPLVYKKFSQILIENTEKKPEYVFGAVHVLYGARIAEAAARRPEDITFFETYATSKIFSQERNGIRDPMLKNEYSRRIQIIGYLGREILLACINKMGDKAEDRDLALTKTDVLSVTIKDWLIEAGLSEDFIQEAGAEMAKDSEEGHPDAVETTAYILRRSFAGLARNRMGLSLREVNHLLGHSDNADENHYDEFQQESTQRKLANSMECVVFIQGFSRNPQCQPIELADGMKVSDLKFSRMNFVNAGDKELELDVGVMSLEPGEDIIVYKDDLDVPLTYCSMPVDFHGKDRLIIGDTRIKEATHEANNTF